MRRLNFLLLLLAAACSRATSPGPSPSIASEPTYTGLHVEVIGSYQAALDLSFEGSYNWRYHLETRTDGQAVEYRLHLEGLNSTRNPGDVRMVMQEDISRMRGAGTEDECVQFPSDLDLGQIFITPDNLIVPGGLTGPLKPLQQDTVALVQTTHYTLRQANLDPWRDLTVDIWRHEATGAALRYDLRAEGPDPLFDAGEGVLVGQFLVNEVGPQTIEPIAGCDIDLPLPRDAARLTKLPGLIALDSAATVSETAAFYQAELPGRGWEPVAEPQASGDAILLSYRQGAQTLDVNIEASAEGVHVALLLGGE